jgi:hypothetical protein
MSRVKAGNIRQFETCHLETPRVWMTLPGELRRRGQELLHQQCWCWGADIRRAEGDWLQEQGFQKTRPPQTKRGSNSYRISSSEESTVTLWGFGLCLGQTGQGSIFISRYSFFPRFCAEAINPDELWKAEQTTDLFSAPRDEAQCLHSLQLLEAALHWMADYERRVMAQLGPKYRHSTLNHWSHVAQSAETMPLAWDNLAKQIRPKARLWRRDTKGLRQLPLH